MKKTLILLMLGLVLGIPSTSMAHVSFGAESALLDEAPASFMSDGKGGFYGVTTLGTPFTQILIFNESNIRLQKFTIGTVYFYITDRGVIYAANDAEAITAYFSFPAIT